MISKLIRSKSLNDITILITFTIILLLIVNIIRKKIEIHLINRIAFNQQILQAELDELQNINSQLETQLQKEKELNNNLKLASKTKENILVEINNKLHEHLLNLEQNNSLTYVIEINDEIEEISIASVLEECKDLYIFHTYRNNITIDILQNEYLPFIYSNKLAFKLLIINLLAQSILYLPKDKDLKINAETIAENKSFVIQIEDNGFGIKIDPRMKLKDTPHAINFFELEWETIANLAKSLGYRVEKQLHNYRSTIIKTISLFIIGIMYFCIPYFLKKYLIEYGIDVASKERVIKLINYILIVTIYYIFKTLISYHSFI